MRILLVFVGCLVQLELTGSWCNPSPTTMLRPTMRLSVNLFLHDFASALPLNATHSITPPYDDGEQTYPAHCRNVLKKTDGLRAAWIGYGPTSDAYLTPNNEVCSDALPQKLSHFN